MPLIGTLAVVGIIYGALLLPWARRTTSRSWSPTCVSHLGFCMLGMFALNEAGLTGSLLQMINHGLSTGGLFLLVGMLYERYHTRQMADYGGMAARLKLLAVCMVFISLSSIGLPGLNGFVGEIAGRSWACTLQGEGVRRRVVRLGSAGIVLGAWYMLTMLRHVFFGPSRSRTTRGTARSAISMAASWRRWLPIVRAVPRAGRLPAAVLRHCRPRLAGGRPASPTTPAPPSNARTDRSQSKSAKLQAEGIGKRVR